MFGAESLYARFFCDKSRKPGKIARAGARTGVGAAVGRCRRASGAAGRRAPDARASHPPMTGGTTVHRPVARWRGRTIDKNREGRQ